MGFKTEYAMAGIIIAIIVSVVGGYFYGQSPITGYKKEINSLEIKNLELSDQQEQLQVELTSLQDQLDNTTASLSATRSFLEDLQAQIEERNEQIKDLELVNARAIQELEQENAAKQQIIEELEQELNQSKIFARVAILVDTDIALEIQGNLNQYVVDIETIYSDIRLLIYSGNWKSPEEVRAFIQDLYYSSSGISGVILVGDLPYAIWEYFPGDIGPLPFYYEDMDGTFEDKDADGIFDHYVWGENEGPEIWVSWMRPDSDNVTRSLNDYLEKLHNYYSGNISYQNKALVVVTEDWGEGTSELSLSLEKIYPEVTSIGGVSKEVTASQYLNEYINWYEITDVWSHGDSNDQEFDQGTSLFGEEVKSLSGGSKLTVIWGCHAGDFHKSPNENLAASYVFNNRFGLATIAATRSIGIEKHEIVFQSLNEGDILGEAFFDWINLVYDKSFIQDRFQQEILIDRFMWGFILMGDPFIQLNKYQQLYSIPGTDEATIDPEGARASSYVSLEILVSVFLNVTQDGIRYDLVGANLDKVYRELEKARRFYWVNSHNKLNLNLTFLIIDKPISFSGWWLGPNVVNPVLQSALISVGQNLSDYDGEIAIWASPGYTDEEDPPGGVGGGGGTVYRYSSFPIGGSVSWLMIHEFHHQLDEFFDKSGYPEYRSNHPRDGGAEDPGNYGEHFDVNAYILRIWPVKKWLELRDLPDFSPTIRETDDSDGDGIPDDDPNVPIDERRFGSDPRLVDTDGDRLNDLDELMAGIYSSSNPNNIDTDGDGLIDGLDPYPLYPLDPWIPKKTIHVDGELESEWYSFTDHFTYLNTLFKASIKLSWDDDYLYIGMETDNFARILIYIDANNDGWFHGKDNYEIIVDPSYTDPSFIIDKAHIWDCTKATEGLTWNEQIITKEDIKRAAKQLGSGYAVELAIPKNVETGLIVNESSKIGLRFEFDNIGRDGKLLGTSFERWSFVIITLETRPDHA